MLFSGNSGVPLIHYHIADQGGLASSTDMQDFCARHGFTPKFDNNLPFVFVFGRSLFAVSFFGANIYPENVTVGLEQPGISERATGNLYKRRLLTRTRTPGPQVAVELASEPNWRRRPGD